MSRAPAALLRSLALVALCAVALAGCGSSSGSGSSSDSGSSGSETSTGPLPPTARGGSGEREAPRGSSTTLREIYRQFPPPKPDSAVKGSAAALRAGERACAGKTPLQVKAAFYAKARRRGLSGEEAKAIAELPQFERHSSTDPSFTAGQLAADVYAATLPESLASPGYEGCVHALAKRLERRLAPTNGSK